MLDISRFQFGRANLFHLAVLAGVMLSLLLVSIVSLAASRYRHMELSAINPFTTDLCSLSPEGFPNDPQAWCHCCVRHDLDYWMGGNFEDRLLADQSLLSCVADQGHPVYGTIMFWAVRLFGGPYSLFSFRWGYGWPLGKPYQDRSRPEQQALQRQAADTEMHLFRYCTVPEFPDPEFPDPEFPDPEFPDPEFPDPAYRPGGGP